MVYPDSILIHLSPFDIGTSPLSLVLKEWLFKATQYIRTFDQAGVGGPLEPISLSVKKSFF